MTKPKERRALLDYARWWRGQKDGQPRYWWCELMFVYPDPKPLTNRAQICESLAYDGTDGP